MKRTLALALFAGSALAAAAPAAAVTINFDNLAVGTILSNQYAGVTFSPNAFSGANVNSTPEGWATNTGMRIVSSTGGDVGALGTPSLVSGNLLRSFNDWLGEDGDPSFLISFSSAINSFSADFAGVATPADTAIFAYNGATLIGTVRGTVTTGQFTLAFAAPSITSIRVAPGSYDDWVGVDNITYNLADAVPEPASWAMMIGGLGMVGGAARARRRRLASVAA